MREFSDLMDSLLLINDSVSGMDWRVEGDNIIITLPVSEDTARLMESSQGFFKEVTRE